MLQMTSRRFFKFFRYSMMLLEISLLDVRGIFHSYPFVIFAHKVIFASVYFLLLSKSKIKRESSAAPGKFLTLMD